MLHKLHSDTVTSCHSDSTVKVLSQYCHSASVPELQGLVAAEHRANTALEHCTLLQHNNGTATVRVLSQ